MKNLIILIFILILSSNVNAQWSSNPALNLTVCDTTNDQVLPKIAVTSDGGCYIGWFDGRSGGYAVYLQKLTAQGVKQFPVGGLLISNNPQSTSLVDWDLAVDDSDCCVLAFTDTRASSSINPYAYRISPTGQFLWGANGIALTDSINVFQANPKVIFTSDGNFVIPWQYNNKVAMQKINKAGTKVWGNVPIMIIGNTTIGEKFNYPTGVKSDAGSIILYWIGYTGSFISPSNYKLYSQKYSTSGIGQWGNPQDTIFNLGNAQGTYQPSIYSDGNNGAIYVWQSYITGPTVCYVQRKNSLGQLQFPVNGSAVTTTGAAMLNFAPSASYMPSTGETYVFWQRKNSLQSLIGVYGQKFSSSGTRLWADSGYAVKPLDANSFASLSTFTKDTSILGYYMELITGGTNGLVKAFKLNRDGTFQWGGVIITPCSYIGGKGRMSTAINQNGMSMLAWQDNRNDGGGIYAQNINLNGTYGNSTGIINYNNNVPDKYSLKQNYPNPFNPSTLIKFEISKAGFVSLKVYDILGKEVAILINNNQNAGKYGISFSTNDYNLSSGIYFYTLRVNDFIQTKMMILTK